MSVTAPLCVPVEIRRSGGGPRFFRLACGVSEQGLLFPRGLPGSCEGGIEVAFVLPADEGRITLRARSVLPAAGDDPDPDARGAVNFVALDEDVRARIARYVSARVPE